MSLGLRQDYASSSATASRRSSSASLQSLRRAGSGGGGGGGGGAYSDQELDSYSLEDEEDAVGYYPSGLGQRRPRCSPSPLGSPRCQSPSSPHDYGRMGGPLPRTHTPRRSLQGPSAELLKYARSEGKRACSALWVINWLLLCTLAPYFSMVLPHRMYSTAILYWHWTLHIVHGNISCCHEHRAWLYYRNVPVLPTASEAVSHVQSFCNVREF